MTELKNISPLDGRYQKSMDPLAYYFSEFALIRYRYLVEVEYLKTLLPEVGVDVGASRDWPLRTDFTLEDAERVKEIEKTSNHDVKSVEYLLREKLDGAGLGHLKQWTHFALTSEDVNNLAYGLMIRDSLNKVLLPKMQELIDRLASLAEEHKASVMLARTHGQPASPTTFGKEMAVFAHRLNYHFGEIKNCKIRVKLAGATGNYNAHVVAYPQVDWPAFAKRFIETIEARATDTKIQSVSLEHNPLVTQIENHDSWARLFHAFIRFNTVLAGFDQDMWRYISDGYVIQKPKKDEVGSSTMPHKVNPINFENSEGNLQLADAGLGFLAEKLLVSRLQRDLTDSTVERNIGVYFGHCLLGYENCLKGLGKVKVNSQYMEQVVSSHPEVLSEAIQTILRREGQEDAYEKLKDLTRGEGITLDSLRTWIETLDLSDAVKKELKELSPSSYVGIASKLVVTGVSPVTNNQIV